MQTKYQTPATNHHHMPNHNLINKVTKAKATVAQQLIKAASVIVLYIDYGGLFFVTFFWPNKRKLSRVHKTSDGLLLISHPKYLTGNLKSHRATFFLALKKSKGD